MYVKMIKLQNIRGIEDLTIKPSALTVISGKNGAGKSTIVSSIVYLGEKSHDPSMIRAGAEKGEIKIEVGDKTGEYDGALFTCTITQDKTTRVLHHPKLGKIPVAKSKEWIESIISMVSLDPVRILSAKPAEQLAIFLEALPITLTADKLAFLPVERVKGLDLDKHALEVIGSAKAGLYGALYEERKGKNAVADDKRGTARQMAETLPAEAPEGQNWNETLDVLLAESSSLQRMTAGRIAEIKSLYVKRRDDWEGRFNQFKNEASAEREAQKRQLKSAFDAEVERLRAKLYDECIKLDADSENEIESSRKKTTELVATAADEQAEELAALEKDYRPKEAEMKEKIGQAKAMVEQHAKAETTRELISKLNADATKFEEESATLTSQMKKLEGLKAELLSTLPIPGLEISDGQILDNGIPLHAVNDAEKYRIVFEMGKLKQGPLGFMVIDRAEIFDDENWMALAEAAKASGMQVLAARRTKGPLAISTESEVA